jgi:hypothetical protein
MGFQLLARRLHHHLGDALGLQPVGQGLQAGGERRVGADLLAASSPTRPAPAGSGTRMGGHHLVLADIQGRGAFHDQLHRLPPPPRSPVLVAPGRANRRNDAETRAHSNSSWCREGPASVLSTGSHAPRSAELGRASPFSSVVVANGHEISDEFRVERRANGEASSVMVSIGTGCGQPLRGCSSNGLSWAAAGYSGQGERQGVSMQTLRSSADDRHPQPPSGRSWREWMSSLLIAR